MVLQDCLGSTEITGFFFCFFFPGGDGNNLAESPYLQFFLKHKLISAVLLLFLAMQTTIIILEVYKDGGDLRETLEKQMSVAKNVLDAVYSFANASGIAHKEYDDIVYDE